MSVEALAITAIVKEGVGGLRKCYQTGISKDDFVSHEEEFAWIEERVANKLPINARVFRRKFDTFEWLPPDEPLIDLLRDLKDERAFTDVNSLLNSLSAELEVENAVAMAERARDILSQITRQFSPVSDAPLVSGWREHVEEMATLRTLAKNGAPPGIPTGLDWIDHHWDGLVNGRMIVILGRPGDGKTYLVNKFGANAIKHKYRGILFSPEMNKHEHICRLHTLLSADKDIQEELRLKHSFRNRALMRGAVNPKTYSRFCEYIEGLGGELVLISGTNRRERFTTGFIEAKVDELQPDFVIIDPIYKLSSIKDRDSRTAELSDISDALQDIAVSFNIPVIVSNQAHRQQTSKDDAPHKDSSFNSDVPIQNASHVIGVKHVESERRMILRCTKSRFGADFRVELDFHANTGVMRERDKPSTNYYNGNDDDFDEGDLEAIVKNANGGSGKKRGK